MRIILAVFMSALITASASAQYPEGFTTGPVFDAFGPVADVEGAQSLPEGLALKHAFDVADAAEEGKANRKIESAARFINMHVRAGIDAKDISVAVVIHGKATADAMKEKADEPTAALIAALIDRGDRVIVCGQSAAAYGYSSDDLLPGVEMAVSAMTAHALLQQRGYTVNPF